MSLFARAARQQRLAEKAAQKATQRAITAAEPLRLDFGCGPNKRPGFVGVDTLSFPGVDVVTDLTQAPWPWANGSVHEAHASHFLEHLTAQQRVTFANELYRVLVPGGKCSIITPHWASCRAYGDPTHQWPPVSEFAYFYWKRDWRLQNAPHTDRANVSWGFDCNFVASWGYGLHEGTKGRNPEWVQFAMTWYKEACTDMMASVEKLP